MNNIKRVCSKCNVPRDISMFQKQKNKPSGQCRICKTDAMKIYRAKQGIIARRFSKIDNECKLCMFCDLMKPFDEFSSSKRGLGGISSYCKGCFNVLFHPRREKFSEYAKRYREKHRERYLSNHRICQFKRKSNIKVSDDGTATDIFLKNLYATERCAYCEAYVPDELRTIDHIIPLIKGGKHSSVNMVMACRSCNSSKRDLTSKEFIERIMYDNNR